MPGNYEIWNLFNLMVPGMVWEGGFDYTAVTTIFNDYEISLQKRRKMWPQITNLIDVIGKLRNEKMNSMMRGK